MMICFCEVGGGDLDHGSALDGVQCLVRVWGQHYRRAVLVFLASSFEYELLAALLLDFELLDFFGWGSYWSEILHTDFFDDGWLEGRERPSHQFNQTMLARISSPHTRCRALTKCVHMACKYSQP